MTAKKIVLATLGAALVAGAALPAFAASDHRGGPGRMGMGGRAAMQDVTFVRLLKTADTNKDGKVSKDEMTARQDALFTEIDANKDGSVTHGELLDYRQAKREEFRKNNPAPQQADNGDDQQQEQRADRRDNDRQGGDRQDGDRRDGDRQAWNHRGWGHHDRDRREARWDGPRGGHMMRGGFFRLVDEDKDGKITKTEASAASDKLFTRMDTNKDGTISIDDLPDRPL